MTVKRFFFWAIGLVLVALVAGGAYLSLYLDRHKSVLEDSLGAALGREVRIEQGVTLEWSMSPSITLRGLWVGNPDWAKGEYLARVERAVLRIDIRDLFRRRLHMEQVTIQNADLALEEAADGRQNWSFGEASGGSPGVLVDALKVQDSRLSYRSAAGEDYRTDVSGIVLEERDDGGVVLDIGFTYRDQPISASASFAARDESDSGNRTFEGQLEIPGVTLQVDGKLAGMFDFANLRASLRNERLDLHETLLPLWPSTPVSGSLQRVTGQFSTAGDTPRSLVSNLDGELKIASADLTRPARKDAKATSVGLRALSLQVTPNRPIRLQSGVAYQEQTYDIALEGGLLEDLFHQDKAWKALKLEVNGKVGGKTLQVSGQVGPLSALYSGRNVKAKLSMQRDGLKVALDGTFTSLTGLAGSRFAVDASSPSLSRLNPVLDLEIPETPPVAITALVEGGERQLRFKKLQVTSGKSDVSGDLSLPLAPGGRLEGTLTSNVIDLQRFLDHPGQPEGHAQQILERELSTAALKDLAGTVRLYVGLLHLDAIDLEQVSVNADLKDGQLKMSVAAENERLTVDVELKPAGTEWQVALNHKGKMDIADLIARTRLGKDDSQAPLEVDMQLKATGTSLTELLQSANGQFLMEIGEGQLSEAMAAYLPLGSVLYTVVQKLLPEGREKQRGTLECVVLQLDIAKGIATSSKGLALRTDQMNLIGGGALNLSTGEIDLRFKTAQRKGIGLNILGVADRLVGVTGTLQNPAIKLDVGTTVAYGAAAWATAGLSVLADSIYTRLTAFGNPCDAVLKAAKNSQGGK